MASIVMLFNILILISTCAILVYCLYHRKRHALPMLAVALLALGIVNWAWWLGWIFIPVILFPLVKKVGFESLVASCMVPAIALAYFFLVIFRDFAVPYLSWVAQGSVTLVCILGILGIFENRLQRYLVYSNLLQLAFVVLDLAVGALAGKLDVLGAVQIFNYTWAGLLFFLTLGLLSRNGKLGTIDGLEGSFHSDKPNATGAVVAGLSLVGLPGLNIFVSEFFLFAFAFSINPLISVLGVFAALVLFIMYFKVPYALLVGRQQRPLPSPKLITGIGLGLMVLCIVFGLVPQLQLWILTGVFI
jgi:NADH-quinone oxidoreductase subunit M